MEMIEAVDAEVDVTRLVGVRAFSLDRVLAMEPDFLEVRGRIPAPLALSSPAVCSPTVVKYCAT